MVKKFSRPLLLLLIIQLLHKDSLLALTVVLSMRSSYTCVFYSLFMCVPNTIHHWLAGYAATLCCKCKGRAKVFSYLSIISKAYLFICPLSAICFHKSPLATDLHVQQRATCSPGHHHHGWATTVIAYQLGASASTRQDAH